jgi:hypothetical protein
LKTKSSDRLPLCVWHQQILPVEATVTLAEFLLGILGIIVILLTYLAELGYYVLNAGFPF